MSNKVDTPGELATPAVVVTTLVTPDPAMPEAPSATILPVKSRPNAVTLIGPVHTTLHKLTALARNGYLPTSLDLYPQTGGVVVTMEIGCPDAGLVEAVEAEMAEALAREEAQRLRDIQAAAVQLVADRERSARKAEMAAKVAEAAATLAALQAAAEAV